MGFFGGALSPDNQDSPIGRIATPIQKYTDPLSWITGGKWADIASTDLPKATNQVLEPIAKPLNEVDQTVNPLRQIPVVNNVANLGFSKPGDSIGLAIGSLFSGGALDGALGGAAGAGGTGAGAGGLTGFLGGPAAVGDSGLTGTVTAGGSGLSSALGGDLGGALGSAPTGLFSGLLPGGGMTGTATGALGGGLSGEAAGAGGIGSATMGGAAPMLGNLFNLGQQTLQGYQQGQQGSQQRPAGLNGGMRPAYRGASPASFVPQSGITLPYTLSSGGADSILRQMMQSQYNPLGIGQG